VKIFEWTKRPEWLEETAHYARDILTDDILENLRERQIADFWSDDLSWFPISEPEVPLADAFLNHYAYVRAFHACRPVDIGSYFRSGLLGQNADVIASDFRRIYFDIDSNLLTRALDEMSDRGSSEEGKTYFHCDREQLIKECGHYLIQGSEYLMSLAACLCRYSGLAEDYRLRLRDAGIPTVFDVKIPVSYIPKPQLLAMMRVIISEWAYWRCSKTGGGENELALILHRNLEPKFISAHSHPARIPDPHSQYRPFVNSETSCEYCSISQ